MGATPSFNRVASWPAVAAGTLLHSLLLAVGWTLVGCASFHPGDETSTSFHQRQLHQEEAGFRVAVSVPASKEIADIFNCQLDHKGIQPVWVSVENRRNAPVYFLPHVMDPDYFAPLEVAYQYHATWQPKHNAALDDFFLTNAMPLYIPPLSTRSGFVFTHRSLGRKRLTVALADESDIWRSKRFTFHAEVPGLKAEHKHEVIAELMRHTEIVECDEARLRSELEKLPRAATNKRGNKEGDPLNLVVIGTLEDLSAFVDCNWTLTERLTVGTAWQTFKSSVFGTRYDYSPMSRLYYAGRPQDISFQKVRNSVNLRNHLRLWITPLRYQGKPVWIGQISRDIGVRWTLQTPNLTTHKINPNVDETRSYLVQDLAPNCRWWSLVQGVEFAAPKSPRKNLTGDPYFTDGLRAVLELTCEPTKPGEPIYKKWEDVQMFRVRPLTDAPAR